MHSEAYNDNGRRFISVACVACGGPTEPAATGFDPICIFCFYAPGPSDVPAPARKRSPE